MDTTVNNRYITTQQFAEQLQIGVVAAQRQCRSKAFRLNRIARKVGNEWRIDMVRYRAYWIGDLKK